MANNNYTVITNEIMEQVFGQGYFQYEQNYTSYLIELTIELLPIIFKNVFFVFFN